MKLTSQKSLVSLLAIFCVGKQSLWESLMFFMHGQKLFGEAFLLESFVKNVDLNLNVWIQGAVFT